MILHEITSVFVAFLVVSAVIAIVGVFVIEAKEIKKNKKKIAELRAIENRTPAQEAYLNYLTRLPRH